VLSNTIWSRHYHREIFERDGVLDLIDADVYSSEIDHVKPHPEAFRTICRALDVDPRRAVYVGDRVFEDVHGPQQVGMRAIWIPHSDIPPSQRVEVTAVPDGRAHVLLDVLDIVDAWTAAR
jgi:putative hydrolase of the HAD superfamily